MLSDNLHAEKAIGANQSLKVIRAKKAKLIYLANDADRQFTARITDEATKHGNIKIDSTFSSKELGEQCGIDVDCAVIAIY